MNTVSKALRAYHSMKDARRKKKIARLKRMQNVTFLMMKLDGFQRRKELCKQVLTKQKGIDCPDCD